MARVIKVKNNTGSSGTWLGQVIASGAYFQLEEADFLNWRQDTTVFTDVGNGDLIVNDGTSDFTDALEGWEWLSGGKISVVQEDERHTADGKLRVLSSHKPVAAGKTFYNFFAGGGDDWENSVVGSGTMFQAQTSSGTLNSYVDVQFVNYADPNAIIWIFGGAFAWADAGWGDTIETQIRAKASSVIPRVTATGLGLDVDYNLDEERIYYAGPDAGDYALGGNPVWVPNFENTGHWNLNSDATAAIPAASGTGKFDWHTTDQMVGHYVSCLSVYGTSNQFTHIDATEAAPLPYGHWIRICTCNTSDTEWKLWGFVKLYREKLK